jgi:hypothetical protein
MGKNRNPRGAAGARVAELQNRRTNYNPKAPTDPVIGFRQACIDPIQPRQPRRLRLPAYAKQLLEAKRHGYTVPWLCVALSWDVAISCPRIVIDPDRPVCEFDLHVVNGLEVLIAHRGQPSRAIDVAEAALRAGATVCPVLDVDAGKLTATTSEIAAARWQEVAA